MSEQSVAALIAVSTQIEAADLKPSTLRVARLLLHKATGGPLGGYVSTDQRALFRAIKDMGPEDGASHTLEVDKKLVRKTLDELAAAGIIGFTWGDMYINAVHIAFMAWPQPTAPKPVNDWIAVADQLPPAGWPVLVYFTYVEGGIPVHNWARCYRSGDAWYEYLSSDRGLQLPLPIVQNVTHWAAVEMPVTA